MAALGRRGRCRGKGREIRRYVTKALCDGTQSAKCRGIQGENNAHIAKGKDMSNITSQLDVSSLARLLI